MKIKMLVMDVDGTLTDGCIYMGAGGEVMKAFNVQDGAGIVYKLPKMGITPVIITGRIPAFRQRSTAPLTSGRGGSLRPNRPKNVRFFSTVSPDKSAGRKFRSRFATPMTRRA